MILRKRESSGLKHVDASLAIIKSLNVDKKIELLNADSIELNLSARLVKKK
jgi:hypothetical protein